MSNKFKLSPSIRSFTLVATLGITLSGCVTTGVNQEASQTAYLSGGYESVSATYLDGDGKLKVKGDDLEQLLISGKALHDAGYWQQSAEAFESAEKQLAWKADSVDTPDEVGKLIGTTLTNDTFASYNGKIYEGVMLDYYQALNYLMMGDESKSRVRFNRLNERQRNAETQLRKYTDSLSKTDKAAGEAKSDKNKQEMIARSQKESGDALDRGKQGLPSGVKAHEIRNPAGDLLGAMFRATSASRSDKQGNLIDGMINSASTKAASSDGRKFASKLKTELKRKNQNHIYFIYEDGRGPSIDEFRVDLPVFLVSKDVLYTGIALPEFKSGSAAQPELRVSTGKQAFSLVKMADLNRMASLEFDATYKGKVAKAVTSAVLKTVAQAAANREIEKKTEGNALAGLLMKTAVAVGQAALTQTDTRAWFNLPDSIHLGVMKRPSFGTLRLTNPAGEPLAIVDLPSGQGDLLVYARQAMSGGEMKVFIQNLPANTQAASL